MPFLKNYDAYLFVILSIENHNIFLIVAFIFHEINPLQNIFGYFILKKSNLFIIFLVDKGDVALAASEASLVPILFT